MISEALQRPIGPLAAWQWGLVIGGGYLGYRVLSGKGIGGGGGGSTTPITPAAIGDPGFSSGAQGPAGPAGPPGPSGTVTNPPPGTGGTGPHGINGGPGGIWSKPPVSHLPTTPTVNPLPVIKPSNSPSAGGTVATKSTDLGARFLPITPVSNPIAPPPASHPRQWLPPTTTVTAVAPIRR